MRPFVRAGAPVAALALAAAAAPSARVAGYPAPVYNFYRDHCPPLPQAGCPLDISAGCDCDIADAPMRMWRRSGPGGDGRVFALASVDLGSRAMSGASPLALEHECALYANSTRAQSFASYANYEWIHSSWYFTENNSAVALTHMEWDCKDPSSCAFFGENYNFFSAVTLLSTMDGGASWAHAQPPPNHLVAAQPIAWNESTGRGPNFGFRSPSGIVAARDGSGFFYATVSAGWDNSGDSVYGQTSGACMMRTRDLTDPQAWRAWGGSAFNVSLGLAASPYANPGVDPAQHRCIPFTRITYATLAWSSLYNAYMMFGTNQGDDNGGWVFQLAADLALAGDAAGWSTPTVLDTQGFVSGGGNASITRLPGNLTGRFVQRKDHGADPQVWYEDAQKSVKRRVGACTPCPGVDACGSLVQIPDAEFDALAERADFSCGALYNTTGFSDYYASIPCSHGPKQTHTHTHNNKLTSKSLNPAATVPYACGPVFHIGQFRRGGRDGRRLPCSASLRQRRRRRQRRRGLLAVRRRRAASARPRSLARGVFNRVILSPARLPEYPPLHS